MSKSKGNVLYADTLVDFFGVDAVRYFVLHELSLIHIWLEKVRIGYEENPEGA